MSNSGTDIGRSHALIISSNEYEDPRLLALRAPSRGAKELAAALADESIGGFDVQVLLDKPSPVLLEEIEAFFADRNRDDLVLLYISCHGILDDTGELHFAASTTRLNRLASTGVSARFVQGMVERCRARNAILLLDCCYSGAFARGYQPRPEGRAELDAFEHSGRVVITSSTAFEYAFEASSGEHTGAAAASVFTTALVEGLRTGDADRDGDGLVSVNELYSFLHDRIREVTPLQGPEMMGHLLGDFIIARNPRGSAREPEATSGFGERAPGIGQGDDPESVLTYWSRVAEVLREGSDRSELASALKRVGQAQVSVEHPEDAVPPLEESAAIFRDLGDRSSELAVLNILVDVYKNLGFREDSEVAKRRVAELRRTP